MKEEEEGGLTRKNRKGGVTRREKEEMEGNELTVRHTPEACRETVGGCCFLLCMFKVVVSSSVLASAYPHVTNSAYSSCL